MGLELLALLKKCLVNHQAACFQIWVRQEGITDGLIIAFGSANSGSDYKKLTRPYVQSMLPSASRGL